MNDDRVVIARVGAAHGVRGQVRLKSYTEVPGDVAAYGPLTAADGTVFEITSLRPASGKAPDMLVVRLKGVGDRTAAQNLTGTDLSVARQSLPPPGDDEFYHADLVGMSAETVDGTDLGTVTSVYNHGAGDILEITADAGASVLVPFTRACVPDVDATARRLVVDEGVFEEDPQRDPQS